MATFTKYNIFVQDLASGSHQMQTGTAHVYKVALTNTAPNVATHAVLADITDLTTANGYTAGGAGIGAVTGAQTSGTFKFVGATDPSWTASGGNIGPFRYAVIYNSTNNKLVGYWDYGTNVTLTNGNTYTADLDQTNGILTVT